MKCTHEKCISGLVGRWKPVLLLWPEGYKQMECQPISVTLARHMLCDICKAHASPWSMIPKDDFERICATVVGHGKIKPSWTTAKLEFFVEDSFGKDFSGEVKLA